MQSDSQSRMERFCYFISGIERCCTLTDPAALSQVTSSGKAKNKQKPMNVTFFMTTFSYDRFFSIPISIPVTT
jgi:hypothetical protein